MSILIVILILIALILVHELGHFSLAKLFGIRVDQFNIGFPPRLFSVQWGETLYSFNLLLLGGYVQIHGENPDAEPSAQGSLDADPRSLSSRSRFVQAVVLLAGIAFNLVFAWLLLSGGYVVGLPTTVEHEGVGTVTDPHPMIVGVLPDSPAQKVGLEGGDTVVRVETATARFDAYGDTADALHAFITAHASQSLVLTVERAGEEKTFLAKGTDGLIAGRTVVGVELDDVGTLRLPPHLALYEGGILAKNIIVQTAEGLGAFIYNLVRGAPDFSQVAGPIGIVTLGGVALKEGASAVLVLAASISIALGLFNLVPIPGLDGGRLFILLIEGVTRRQVPPRLVLGLTLGGMALLVLLMVVVSYHDITKLVG